MEGLPLNAIMRQCLDTVKGFGTCRLCGASTLLHRLGDFEVCAECLRGRFAAAGVPVHELNRSYVSPYAEGVPIWAPYRQRWEPAVVIRRSNESLKIWFTRRMREARRGVDQVHLRNPFRHGADRPNGEHHESQS